MSVELAPLIWSYAEASEAALASIVWMLRLSRL